MNNYIISKEILKNIVDFQAKEFYKDFKINKNKDILISYNPKFYTCNDKKVKENDKGIMAISFFSGCGGLDIGTQLAGVKVLSTLDNYEDSVETMKLNKFFKDCIHMKEDIKNVKGKDFEEIIKKNNPKKLIVVGGPPCQPFSKAGYWVTNEKRNSSEDERNMIEPYFKIISEIKPDGFVLENVESILHPSNKEAVESIINNMNKLGYYYSLLKVNAADYGIPQKRKRVFFLASKNPINASLKQTHGSLKELNKNPDLLPYERVIDWIGKYDDIKYYKNEDLSTSGKWEKELTMIPPGKNYIALTEKAGHPTPVFVAGKRYWNSLLKLHPYEPSCTIIASPGHWEGPFHWNNRRLSIKECAAIQTFPEDYEFFGSIRSQRKQIGNAVPPLLAKKIIEELCRWL